MMNEPLITVITATTGRDTLYDTLLSVQKQTYKNIQHVIVCDGEIHYDKVSKLLNDIKTDQVILIKPIIIPWQTGLNNWICHRIYAAIPHIIIEDCYISFLDEDNYIDENHYEELIKALNTSPEVEWVYSLRKIVSESKELVTYDMCESLGNFSKTWIIYDQLDKNKNFKGIKEDPAYYLIDTNCYLIKKNILHKISEVWQTPARNGDDVEADRRLFNELRKYIFVCSMKYTMNYRLDSRDDSASFDFFTLGNAYMNKKYNNEIPWAPPCK
jgi:hypothetical protein